MAICNNKKCSLGECDQPETCTAYVPTKTNADLIRAMSDEKLAHFIHEIAHLRETPWSIPFEEANCKSCSHVIGLVDGYYQETEFHECDFEDGKCPHGNDILWWLQQEAEEE